jgi:PAS domain S-box-containing protein
MALEDHQTTTDNRSIQNTPLGIIEWTNEFKIKVWNGKAEEIFGWKEEEVLGLDPFEINLIHKEDEPLIKEKIELLSSGKTKNDITINRNCTKDNKIRYVEWYNSVITDEDENVISIFSLAHDVTARVMSEKWLAKEKKFNDSIINSLPGIFYIVGQDGRFINWNKNLEEKTGYSKKEIRKMYLLDLFPETKRDQIASNIYTVYEAGIVKLEAPIQTKSTELLPHQFTFNLLQEENEQMLIGVGFDISDKIKKEELMSKLNIELQEQTKALAESNQDLEQFAYIVSHDLQEPLRMVTGFLTLIEKKFGSALGEDGGKYIAFAVDGAERMKNLINDLLNFSRVGKDNGEFRDVSIEEIIDNSLILLRQSLEESEAVILKDSLPQIRGNEIMLKQLFQNLIGNALKYKKKDAKPVVRITCRDMKGEWLFAINDNGIGIDEKNFERIFLVFQRLHAKKEYSGTGIGLAICKKIVEKHNGKIWVESENGDGSTFYFSIPKKLKQKKE